MEIHQLVLTENVMSKNHTIDWEGVRCLAKEPDWKKRGVTETIVTRNMGMYMISHDRGHHHLPEVFSKLCATRPSLMAYS